MIPLKYCMLATAVFLAACSGTTTSPTNSDLTSPAGSRVTLRFVNTTGVKVNLYINSMLKSHAEWFDSGPTSYLQASSVPQAVTVKWAVDPRQVLASAPITFTVDTPYTVVFTANQHPQSRLIVLPDTVSAPPPGAASFRLVRVASGLGGPVDVYHTTGSADLTGLTPVASNVADETSSPYVSSPAGPIRIIVTVTGYPDYVLFDSGTRTLSAGEAWTMLLMYRGIEPSSALGMWIKDRS